jgi:hypothetical protein
LAWLQGAFGLEMMGFKPLIREEDANLMFSTVFQG